MQKSIGSLFMAIAFCGVLAGCSGGSGSAPGAAAQTQSPNSPAPKTEGFVKKSASDLRREIAAANADARPDTKKGVSKSNEIPSTVYYTCDRETLPRTCCYYILNGGGGVYGGSPSCTEENH